MSTEGTIEDVLAGRARWALVRGVCLDVLPTLPEKSVDHVITDPPYDARTHAPGRVRSLKNGGSDIGIDFAPLDDFSFVPNVVAASKRWTIAFCAVEQMGSYADAAGPDAWIRAAIWHRVDGTPQISGDRPAQAAEGIAVMHNPSTKKRWNGGGSRGLWSFCVERNERVHPTQKPLSLMTELVELFTDPDEIILDPFAGSSTTGVAALRLGRRFIGIERYAKYAELSRERLRATENGTNLASVLRDRSTGQLDLFGGSQ